MSLTSPWIWEDWEEKQEVYFKKKRKNLLEKLLVLEAVIKKWIGYTVQQEAWPIWPCLAIGKKILKEVARVLRVNLALLILAKLEVLRISICKD
jgi:hypothetical protein